MSDDGSRADATRVAPDSATPPLDPQAQSARSMTGLAILLERLTPWLFEVGSWLFGGLIAFNLVIVSALLTVGPVDGAILVATATLAAALPLNVAGIVLLRLTKDAEDIALDTLTLEAFEAAGFQDIGAYFPPAPEREAQRRKRSRVALGYSAGIAMSSAILTLAGLGAALWHMAWWIGIILVVMVVLSVALVAAVVAHSLPPESAAEKALQQRYKEYRARQRRWSKSR